MRIEIACAALLPSLAFGMNLGLADEVPTFSRDVAPILRMRCQECHRAGQIGPFPLATFEQARKRSADLVTVVKDRRMPPWKPEPGFGPKLQHDRSLTPAEVSTLERWVQGGSLPGHDRDLAPARPFVEGWTLGTPDLVLEPSEDFAVPASGSDLYRCFVIPTSLPADLYVSAVEYRPGNRRVVHHLMAFVETAGAARVRDEAEPGPGYSSFSGAGVEIVGDLGGWAPGNEARHLPEGVGRSLPRNADVILQVHYHPSGKPEIDRTRIGLHFSRKPVRQTLQWKGVMSQDIRLPAGEADIRVKASWFVPVAVDLLAVAPHMHRLGRDMKITASYPNGRSMDLIRIPDWDPDWQGTYSFETPIHLPRGSTIHVVGRFDNSDRPANPHQPPRLVKFGHGSTDEMCVGYVAVVKSGQDLTRTGEKDDLFAIFVDQYWRGIRREQMSRRRR
jgi:Copper type II ascorbate-dependent monooxygenase, C-terminal domain